MLNHFAANLTTLRKREGLNMRELSEKLKGACRNNIYTWEAGHEPSFDRVIEIAAYFNITIDQLLKELL